VSIEISLYPVESPFISSVTLFNKASVSQEAEPFFSELSEVNREIRVFIAAARALERAGKVHDSLRFSPPLVSMQ